MGTHSSLLLLIAGAKGAIATTLAAALAAARQDTSLLRPYLTTAGQFPFLGPVEKSVVAGWDSINTPLFQAANRHGVLPKALLHSMRTALEQVSVKPAPPDANSGFTSIVEQIIFDIETFKAAYPDALPVLINLLPAGPGLLENPFTDIDALPADTRIPKPPDLAYGVAALKCDVPIVNFSPNSIEIPALTEFAAHKGIPICGRDGKTGQTYLKVVLASALKARSLYVDGWYSTNILGNADGLNLEDPACAAGKISNKTNLLDDILGYPVGERYDRGTHTVRIDYYPPRGDAKEAWDVIDFMGLFGLPMSLRVNLQGRDSILAAPMVLDLARWAGALKLVGRGGAIPELGFYFKKPIGPNPPRSQEEQLAALARLGGECRKR